MSLILIQTIVQAVSSTLTWLGFYIGIRALPDARARKSRWIVGSAMVAAAWLVGVFLLGAANVFRNDALPPRVPMALFATLLLGYLLLLSSTFRQVVAAVPQHWLHRHPDLPCPGRRVLGPLLRGRAAIGSGLGQWHPGTGERRPEVASADYSSPV
jgi:hypothetical protein